METIISAVILAAAYIVVKVNQSKIAKKRNDYMRQIATTLMRIEISNNGIANFLNRANELSVKGHIIGDWDKEKWNKELEKEIWEEE